MFTSAQIESKDLKEVLPNSAEKEKSITVKITKNDKLFVNEIKTTLENIIPKIDSLNSVGFEDSPILLERDLEAKIELVIDVTDLLKTSNKKVIMKIKSQ